MPLNLSRRQYAEMFGPTTGDRVRLADTDLFIEVERDLIAEYGGYGNEVKFGGGKVIRDGMGQSPLALDVDSLDLVIIENVGNLVCPAEFDVGEHAKAMVYSVTEGDDKPLKYPVMFRAVDVVLLNKIDLVPHLDVDVDSYIARVREVNPTATILPVSARTGVGMADWFDWLRQFTAGSAA